MGACGAVLAQRAYHAGRDRRLDLVAAAGRCVGATPAGRTLPWRNSCRAAPRPLQSAPARDVDPRRRLLHFRERLLGAAAARRARPGRRRAEALRHAPWHYRRRRRGRRLRVALAQAAARRRQAGGRGYARDRARARTLCAGARARGRTCGKLHRRRVVDRGARDHQRIGAARAAGLGARARALDLRHRDVRRLDLGQRLVGPGRGAHEPADRAFDRGGRRSARRSLALTLEAPDRRRR